VGVSPMMLFASSVRLIRLRPSENRRAQAEAHALAGCPACLLGFRLHHFQIDGNGDVVADERASTAYTEVLAVNLGGS
jgi:hypothetical protein